MKQIKFEDLLPADFSRDLVERIINNNLVNNMNIWTDQWDASYKVLMTKEQQNTPRFKLKASGVGQPESESTWYLEQIGYRVFFDEYTEKYWKVTYTLSSWNDEHNFGDDYKWERVYPHVETVTVYRTETEIQTDYYC